MKLVPISVLRGILASISRQVMELEAIPTMTEEEALEVGWLLWRIGQLAEKAQDKAKEMLRLVALIKSRGQPGPVKFTGPGRVSCQVVIQEPRPKLRKDAPLGDVAPLIPKDVWNRLFEERYEVVPTADFQEVFQQV